MFKIKEEDIEKMAEAIVKELETKEKENNVFINTKQDETAEKVYNFLQQNDIIDAENILYFPEKYTFTEKEFVMFFENIRNYAEEINKKYTNKENYFPNHNYFLEYKDLKIILTIMWGQGTALLMRKASNEEWKNQLSFTYENYKASINM